MGVPLDGRDIVGDHRYRPSGGSTALEFPPKEDAAIRVEASGGFVEQQKVRIVEHPRRQVETPPLAARERIDTPWELGGETKGRGDVGDTLLPPASPNTM